MLGDRRLRKGARLPGDTRTGSQAAIDAVDRGLPTRDPLERDRELCGAPRAPCTTVKVGRMRSWLRAEVDHEAFKYRGPNSETSSYVVYPDDLPERASGARVGSRGVADATQSTNWSGYAAHGSRVTFRGCPGLLDRAERHVRARRSDLLGLLGRIGRLQRTSKALEQIGTEVDCTTSGRINSTAWYELVPRVETDRIRSSRVTRSGVGLGQRQRRDVELNDITRGQHFRKTLPARRLT